MIFVDGGISFNSHFFDPRISLFQHLAAHQNNLGCICQGYYNMGWSQELSTPTDHPILFIYLVRCAQFLQLLKTLHCWPNKSTLQTASSMFESLEQYGLMYFSMSRVILCNELKIHLERYLSNPSAVNCPSHAFAFTVSTMYTCMPSKNLCTPTLLYLKYLL